MTTVPNEPVFPNVPQEKLTPSEVLSRAETAFLEEDFERCTNLLDAIGEERAARLPSGRRAKYYELRGDIAADESDYDGAAESFTALSAAERESGEPPVGLAFSYSRLAKALTAANSFDEAHDAFREAVGLLEHGNAAADDRISIWFGYGHALWEADRHETAISALEEALRMVRESNADARAAAGMAYFLASSWAQVVQVQSLAEKASEIFNEAALAGVEKPEGSDEIDDAAREAAMSRKKGEAAAVDAIEWLKRAEEKDFLFARAYKDYAVILAAGGKHDEAADALRSAIGHAKGDDFSEASHAGLRESLGESLAASGNHTEAAATFREAIAIRESGELSPRRELFRMLAESLAQCGETEEAGEWESRALELEAEEKFESEEESEESDNDDGDDEPMVRFPFDLSTIEIDEDMLRLLDLDFDPGSFDYLEGYQLNTGTWWVCGFARNGIRDLFGFQLMPGGGFRDSPVVCVAENESRVSTYCRSLGEFLPARILDHLYSSWDEFSELTENQWASLVQLHHALGGTGRLEEIRQFINSEKQEDLLKGKNRLSLALDSAKAAVPNSDEIDDDDDNEEDEPGDGSDAGEKTLRQRFGAFAALPADSVWKTRYAASVIAAGALAGIEPGPELKEAAWTIVTSPAPLDLDERAIEPGDVLRGALILVVQFQEEMKARPGAQHILEAARTAVDAGEDYDGVAHFHAALALIGAGEHASAFRALATFAFFSAVKVGMAAPPALDAAVTLARLAGWTDVHSSLTYVRTLRETDDWPDEVKDACVKVEARVEKAFAGEVG